MRNSDNGSTRFYLIVIISLLAALAGLHHWANSPAHQYATRTAARPPAPQAGKLVSVKRVVDGDTLVTGDNQRVRLAQIDAPEHDQPGGSEAADYLASLLDHEQVTLVVETTDRYGRLVADVVLEDGTSANYRMVAAGHAWCYTRYAHDPRYAAAQNNAAQQGLGLWASETAPINPETWRHSHASR